MRSISVRAQSVIAAAITSIPAVALAAATNDPGYSPAQGQQFFISTSGATALGAFTRANAGSPTSVPPQGAYTRSALALGSPTLRIGQTVYTRGTTGQFLGIPNLNAVDPLEPSQTNDRLVYQYLERGSINGLNDLVNSNGLRIGAFPIPTPPLPTNNQPLWQNGNYLNNGTATAGGYTYTTQGPVRIAWSDVRFEQGFSVPGTGAVAAAPTAAGYGLGRGTVGGSNFQQLASSTTVLGGVGSGSFIKNNNLAVVPFNLVANPGTGLARVTKEEGGWLQATGRLANGANFNSTTRDAGSGTRNQGALNLGVDPSWGTGERDRVSLAATYNDIDPNGTAVTITQGVSEANPERSIMGGSLTPDLNERRVSPTIRFADKTGGSVLREVVVNSRLGIGVLSAGDSRASGGTALSTNTNAPLRALAIDFANGDGFNQARASNVTEGRYDLWSASQAITVSGTLDPDGSGAGTGTLVAANANAAGTLFNDQDDEAALGTLSSQTGVAKKFLSNITGSIAADIGSAETVRTPAEAILNAGFILPQIMNVEKPFDGTPDTLRNGGTGRSSTPPAGGGLSEQALFNVTAGSPSSNLSTQNNWVDPSTQNGNLAGGGVRYNLFAQSNTSSTSATNADVSITINNRTVLAGDLDGDTVRDLGDVEELALAYANSQAYAGTQTGSLSVSAGTFATRAAGGLVAVPGANTAAQNVNTNLVVLTDFNSNGNIAAQAGSVTLTAVERSDVRYFLYGATIDTSGFNNAATVTLNGSDKNLTAAENRRENGVRLGQLRKNEGIIRFNGAVDGLVGTVVNPATTANFTQGEADGLKFDRFDVNNDGSVNRDDAKAVDRNVGKNYTVLADVLGTTDDLIAAELNDNNAITHVDPSALDSFDGSLADLADIRNDSDFQQLRGRLGGLLLDGDADINGSVNLDDFTTLAANFGNTVDQWSDADFNFDGAITLDDFTALAANFGLSAPSDLPRGAVPEPTTMGLIGLASMSLLARRRGK